MRLVIVRFRDPNSHWFVGEKDEQLSALLGQPVPKTDAESMITTWPTRPAACAYAQVVARLLAEHPDKTPRQVAHRAREIVSHG